MADVSKYRYDKPSGKLQPYGAWAGVWFHLGNEWRQALANPYYILAWQILLLLIIYES